MPLQRWILRRTYVGRRWSVIVRQRAAIVARRGIGVIFLRQGRGALAQLVTVNAGGRGRGPVHQVRHVEAVRQQATLRPWGEQRRGEARAVQRLPEAVARMGEVVAGASPTPKPRVDAAEEHLETGGDHILNGSAL
jgi:hypothetical protein